MDARKLAIGLFCLGLSCSTSAGVIEFNVCASGCGFVDASRRDTVESVATLEFSDNGQNGVDFALTNNIGNLLPGNTTSFVPRLLFNLDGEPTSVSNASANIDFFDFDGTVFSGLDFDLEVDFANILSTGLRITDGATASWTFDGIQESAIVLPALVQIFERTTDATVGAQLLGSFSATPSNPVQQVPEPGPLGLSLVAIGLLVLRNRGKKASLS